MPRAPQSLPEWRLPPGVPRSVLDYARSARIAEGYDAYHGANPLFELERRLLGREFDPPGVVADLGCGSGRALLPLLESGHRGLAIDLSEEMLAVVRQKAARAGLAIECVAANLVELDPLPDASIDYAMCLFSTLGMIRGRGHRRRALGHFRRVLRPGGKLVLHAHNFWFNLRDGGGPWWALGSLARGVLSAEVEVGDKWFPYRGVPNFYLHAFRRRELRADLRAAGFASQRWSPIAPGAGRELPRPWLASSLRAVGWLIVCRS